MKKTHFLSIAYIVICSLLTLPAAGAQTVELRSPDGSLSVPLSWNEEEMLVYQFSADGKLLIDNWFYQGLAGILPDPVGPGFKKIIIKPNRVGDLTWVKAHHDSPYGRIVSNWKLEAGKLTMEVTVPPNTTATIFVPAKDAAGVTESGGKIGEARAPALSNVEGVKFLRMENNAAVYAVGSGTYQFQSSLAKTAK